MSFDELFDNPIPIDEAAAFFVGFKEASVSKTYDPMSLELPKTAATPYEEAILKAKGQERATASLAAEAGRDAGRRTTR